MKTAGTVKLPVEQLDELKQLLGKCPFTDITSMVQRGVKLFLSQEAPVYLAAYNEAQKKLNHRQNATPAKKTA